MLLSSTSQHFSPFINLFTFCHALILSKVKGISTDDFHAHLQWFANTLLTRRERKAVLDKEKSRRDLPQLKDLSGDGIRDLLSAAPSPWNSNREFVEMSLSTYGVACISVKAEWYNQQFTVTHRVELNRQLILNFIIGAIIIIVSKEVAKSKYFHYLSGSAIFIAFGGLLATLYLVSIFNKKGSNKFFGILLTVGGYGISVAWLVFNRIRSLLMDYIEIVFIYCGIMAGVGIFFTSRLRSGENKPAFRLAVKFLIRFIALVVLYNSTASPMTSLLTVFSSLVLFLFLPESYR